MQFQLLPLLDTMIAFYRQPRGRERFEDYLRLALNDARDAPQRPIFIYNPMGREHVLAQLEVLHRLEAERLAAEEIEGVNIRLPAEGTAAGAPRRIEVGLNLADDLLGGWTNRYTTDYSLRFPRKLTALHRHYCTPIFWTSDQLSTALIRRRVGEALWRSVYWFSPNGGVSHTLEDHLRQEDFVRHRMAGQFSGLLSTASTALRARYETYRLTQGPAHVLAILYGDFAAESLGHRALGVGPGLLAED